MRLNHADIAQRLPHAGAMCFLDAVTDWDLQNICCSAAAPALGHPLMRDGKLSALVAIEYAAQATALHGALLDGATAPKAGMLARLRGVDFHCLHFPENGRSVTIRAKLSARTAGGCAYFFDVSSAHQPIASGYLLVAFKLPPEP